MREGRLFTAGDGSNNSTVVVNEAMARALWPGESAVGKRFSHPEADPTRSDQWATVIGVVEDTRFAATLTSPNTRYQFYQPMGAARSATVVLRTRGAPESLAVDLRRLVVEQAPGASLDNVISARTLIDQTLINIKLLAWMLFAFAALGLVVSALGVYSLFAGYVIQRTREIGVRMALGAQAGQVLRLVLGKGMRLALLGGVLGVAGAVVVARVLTSLAAELPAHEPIAVVVLATAMLAVALFACWLPARRAAGWIRWWRSGRSRLLLLLLRHPAVRALHDPPAQRKPTQRDERPQHGEHIRMIRPNGFSGSLGLGSAVPRNLFRPA